MKLVKFSQGGRNAEGVLVGDEVRMVGGWRDGPGDQAPFELSRAAPQAVPGLLASSTLSLPLADVKLELPIDPRNKIICIALNYGEHVAEGGREAPKQPNLFLRHIDSLVGPADPLVAASASETYDFEGEIALVIGKVGRNIPKAAALDHVAGYSCFMDGSVREFQQQHSMTAGKNFWRSGSMGPWISTADEVEDPRAVTLATRLNGEVVQSATASEMIFDIPSILAYCSIWMQLNPGDVIATGTPSGVGRFRKPPLWLKPGDRLEIEVGSVGVLSNGVIAQD